MAAQVIDADKVRAKVEAKEKLEPAEQQHLDEMLSTVGQRAWKKSNDGKRLTQEESAWLDTFILVGGRAAKLKLYHKKPLTEDERQLARAYERRSAGARTVRVYFASDRVRRRYEELAAKAGFKNFSAWIVEQLDLAAHGDLVDPNYVQMMKDRIQELEEREKVAFARAKDFEQRFEDAEAHVQRLHDLFVQLAERLSQQGQGKAVKDLEDQL